MEETLTTSYTTSSTTAPPGLPRHTPTQAEADDRIRHTLREVFGMNFDTEPTVRDLLGVWRVIGGSTEEGLVTILVAVRRLGTSR